MLKPRNNAAWGSLLQQTLGLAELRGTKGTGFPSGSDSKESACNSRDLGVISGSGRSPGEENSHPPISWPEEFHGLYSPWSRKELDMTE